MLKNATLLPVLLVLAALMLTVHPGCGSARAVGVADEAPYTPTDSIYFDPLYSTSTIGMRQPETAKDLIVMASQLSLKNDHQGAATLIREAVGLRSEKGEFRVATLAALAYEYLMMGDYDQYKTTMSALRSNMNRYEMLHPPYAVKLLLLLDSVEDGDRVLSLIKELKTRYRTVPEPLTQP